MSEYIKTDVGEYLTSRTGNYEKSPPEELWKHIENNIPTYSRFVTNKSLLKYLIGGISLSAIIVAFLLIYFQPFSTENSNSTPTLVKNSIPVKIDVSTKTINQITTEPVNTVKTTIATVENNTQKTAPLTENNIKQESVSKNETIIKDNNSVTYSINASGLKNLNAISFVNDKNETVLISKNPTPNSFGFYIIDISQLAKGSYNIMLTSSEGKKLHKRETFK